MLLWSAKVAKALCQSSNVAPHQPMLIKKTAALCFVSWCWLKVFAGVEHKTTAFEVW